MSITKNSILSAIDELHDLDNQATMHVCESMVDVYCKACTVLENCEEDSDISSFSIFKEGYYMEEDEITKTEDGGYKINGSDQTYYKDNGFRRMKDDGSGLESILWSILAAIPRMIQAAIEAMFGKKSVSSEDVENNKKKGEAVEKTIKSVPSEIFEKFIEGTKHIGSIIGENLGNLDPAAAAGIGGGVGLIGGLLIHLDKKKKAKLEAKKYYNEIIKNIDKNPNLKKIFKNAYILFYDKEGNAQNPVQVDFEFVPDPDNQNNIKVKTDLNFDGIIAYYKSINAAFDEINNFYYDSLNAESRTLNINIIDNIKSVDQFYKPDANIKHDQMEGTTIEYLTVDEISRKFDEIHDAKGDLESKMKQAKEYIEQMETRLKEIAKDTELTEEDMNTVNKDMDFNNGIKKEVAALTKHTVMMTNSLTFFTNNIFTVFTGEINMFSNLSSDEYKALFTSGEDDPTMIEKMKDFLEKHGIHTDVKTPAALQNILNFVKSIPGNVAEKFKNTVGTIKDKAGAITNKFNNKNAPAGPTGGPETEETSEEPGEAPPVEENTEEIEESFYFNFRG